MEKIEILKLINQYLNEKGYNQISHTLQKESKINLEPKQLIRLKNKIKEGDYQGYEEAIQIILKHCNESEQIYIIPKIRLAQIFSSILTNFDEGKINESINLIRNICNSNNLYDKDSSIEKCSKLIFIKRKGDLIKKMKEISKVAYSKENLIEFILSHLSKSNSILKSLNAKSLEMMVDNVMMNQIKKCNHHMTDQNLDNFSYFEDHLCNEGNMPRKCIYTIEKFDEEILNLILSPSGNYFAVILKSNFVVIFIIKENSDLKNDIKNKNKKIILSQISLIKAHENTITSLHFNKSENKILTSSKDKTIKVFDIFTCKCLVKIDDMPGNIVSSAIFYENDTKILATCLGQKLTTYNMNGAIISSFPTVTVNEILYSEKLKLIILIAPTIKSIILYDYENNEEIEKLYINDTIVSTSLSIIDKGEFLLVNSSNLTPVLSLWNLSLRIIVRKYFGHRQERLNVKCAFGGDCEKFVLCGSDTKEIFIWNRTSSIPIHIIKAHGNCVNSIIWPNFGLFKNILISGSDDHTIKIFSNDKVDEIILVDKDKLENNKYSKNIFNSCKENGKLKLDNRNNINTISSNNITNSNNMRNSFSDLNNINSSINDIDFFAILSNDDQLNEDEDEIDDQLNEVEDEIDDQFNEDGDDIEFDDEDDFY